MGNNLCKSNHSCSPVNSLDNFSLSCPNIFSLPRSKPNYWRKQVVTTRPPYFSSNNTKNNKWENAATLVCTQPLTMNQKILKEHPIPPPRKKKLIGQQNKSMTDGNITPKNGFQEVFGQANDFSSSSDTSYSQTKLKFGNKKTDKFFGENLSDSLSDEPYENDKENTSNYSNEVHINNKAAFLMTMLDESGDDKVDGDVKNENQNNSLNGPKKPQRDMGSVKRPPPPSPPIRRKRSEANQTISFETTNIECTAVDLNSSKSEAEHFGKKQPKLSMPNLSQTPVKETRHDTNKKVFQKSISTNSFLTRDLMEALRKHNYDTDFSVDDGSSAVLSKMSRKIVEPSDSKVKSNHKRDVINSESQKTSKKVEEEKDIAKNVKLTEKTVKPEISIIIETSESKNEIDEPPIKPPRKSSQGSINLEKMVLSSAERIPKHQIVADIYQNQQEIVFEFQKFLEEELRKSPAFFENCKVNHDDCDDDDVAVNEEPVKEQLIATPIIKIDVIDDDNLILDYISSSSESTSSVATVAKNDTKIAKDQDATSSASSSEPIKTVTHQWFFQENSNDEDASSTSTDKVFPFGDIRKRHDSGSFFETVPYIEKVPQTEVSTEVKEKSEI